MAPPVVALEGDLRVISLFDLGQLLRLNGATGCLAIEDGDRKGALYFDGGELINAVDDVAHCHFAAPSVLRRGDLSVARVSQDLHDALDRHAREVLGAQERGLSRRTGGTAGADRADAVRVQGLRQSHGQLDEQARCGEEQLRPLTPE